MGSVALTTETHHRGEDRRAFEMEEAMEHLKITRGSGVSGDQLVSGRKLASNLRRDIVSADTVPCVPSTYPEGICAYYLHSYLVASIDPSKRWDQFLRAVTA